MNNLHFTFPEVLSLLGVAQCVYILVYITFRVEQVRYVTLPILYFFTLACAFFIDFSYGYISDLTAYYAILRWFFWTLSIPLSTLLVMQMSRITVLPPVTNWLLILVVPLALVFSMSAIQYDESCQKEVGFCQELFDWLNITGLIAGAVSLLILWFQKNLFEDIAKQKAGKERYWLILSLIVLNIFFLALLAYSTTIHSGDHNTSLIRTILGLAFVYLVSTSLFRIYPSALILSNNSSKTIDTLNESELVIARKIEDLFALEKVYHESTYSRSDLAKELGVSDSTISKVINLHFNKSFPQLLSDHRIHDAKILLLDTNASVKIVANEVGFNSIATFNRVFKENVGQSPSEYRKNTIK